MKNGMAMISNFSMPGEQFQRHRLQRHIGEAEQKRRHRQAQGNRHRHAGDHQRREDQKNNGCVHLLARRSCPPARSGLRCQGAGCRAWHRDWCFVRRSPLRLLQAIDVAVVMVRQLAGADQRPPAPAGSESTSSRCPGEWRCRRIQVGHSRSGVVGAFDQLIHVPSPPAREMA